MNINEFVDSEMRIEGDFLYDKNDNVVMSYLERPIMQKAAEVIALSGGDVLNIGFGLGIIDEYIQEYNPSSHTIIEINKSLVNKMLEDGWGEKCNVVCDDWKPVADQYIAQGVKFDGIYFDIYPYIDNSTTREFNEKYFFNLLKPGGVYSFYTNWNHLRALQATFRFCDCSVETVSFDLDKSLLEGKKSFGMDKYIIHNNFGVAVIRKPLS